MYTVALYLLCSSFKWGPLGYSEILKWVTVQKRLKTTALQQTPLAIMTNRPYLLHM